MKLAIVSGGFDPVHVGHIELCNKARNMADSLFVIVYNDAFLERMKGRAFMPLKERIAIMQSLKGVEVALESVDEDDTVCETLTWLRAAYKPKFEEMLFCNGGDRVEGGDTPEHELCLKIGIKPVYGLGDKIQSSSWLLDR